MRMTTNAKTATYVSGIRQDMTGLICVNRLRADLDARHPHFGLAIFWHAVARAAGYCAAMLRMAKPATFLARALKSLFSLALEARSRRQWLRQRPVGIVPVA